MRVVVDSSFRFDKKYHPRNNICCFPLTNNVSINLTHNACPPFRGLVLWLGYLGCSILGDWDSLYFLDLSIPASRRRGHFV